MKLKCLMLIFVFVSSCTEDKKAVFIDLNEEIDLNTIELNDSASKQSFKKIWIDPSNSRLFAVIDTSYLFQEDIIERLLCDYYSNVDNHSILRISFFKDKESANYKDELFEFYTNDVSKEYQLWLEFDYLAEYNHETRIFKTYPTSNDRNKKKKVIFKSCE